MVQKPHHKAAICKAQTRDTLWPRPLARAAARGHGAVAGGPRENGDPFFVSSFRLGLLHDE